MNSRLRPVHGRLVLGLCVLLPIGLVAAIASREPIPADGERAAVAVLPEPEGAPLVLTQPWIDAAIGCRVWPGTGGGAALLELEPQVALGVPDVLVYWGAAAEPLDRLTGDEFLLGSLAGTQPARFALPPEAAASVPLGGRVVLYSLAHAEVVVGGSLEAPLEVKRSGQ